MNFDYEQSIWGRGTASTSPFDPTSIRLRNALTALEQVPLGGSVLEIGSGAGQFIRAIKKLRPGLSCFGTDISLEAIKLAESANDGVEYRVCQEEKLPYSSESFDAILIFDVLEHVVHPELLLAEAARVLKPNGLIYAFVPCEGDRTSIWKLLETLHLKRDLTKRFAGHIQYFSRRYLSKIVTQSGFKIKYLRYSEHFLGQLAGILAFSLMAKASRKRGVKQLNNETYFEENRSASLNFVSAVGNMLIFLESAIFRRLPSPNVHLVARKI